MVARTPAAVLKATRGLAAATAVVAAAAASAREPGALARLTGERVALELGPGERALVVHFWATWCSSCVEELPVVARAAEACAPHGVRVRIAAAGEGADAVQAYLREHDLVFEALLDPGGRAWRAARSLGLPANWIRTSEGDRTLSGPRTPAQWRELLGELGCALAPDGADEG